MLETVKKLLGRNYSPLNKITLSFKNLKANYQYLSRLNPQIKVAPVLKSNAYGHGLKLVAKILDELNPPLFCVDSLYEAYELLKMNIKTPVLIMGYVQPENLRVKNLPFSYAVYDEKTLKGILKYQPQAGLHLFVDTGMHREGMPLTLLPHFLSRIKRYPQLKIEGLMSHLACLDQKQISNFEKAQKIISDFGFEVRWRHLLASPGLLNYQKFQNYSLGNLARIGLAMYDYRPVLKLTSTLVQIKTLEKGEKVGYDFTFEAPKKMVLGILPIGYNDGVDRRLSNIGKVLLGKQICPIVGRVSMNITVIDLSKVKNPQTGQEAIVYSDNPDDINCVDKVADLIGTIPYEIFIHLPSSLRREIILK